MDGWEEGTELSRPRVTAPGTDVVLVCGLDLTDEAIFWPADLTCRPAIFFSRLCQEFRAPPVTIGSAAGARALGGGSTTGRSEWEGQ